MFKNKNFREIIKELKHPPGSQLSKENKCYKASILFVLFSEI